MDKLVNVFMMVFALGMVLMIKGVVLFLGIITAYHFGYTNPLSLVATILVVQEIVAYILQACGIKPVISQK